MKIFRLSSAEERTSGITFSIVITVCLVFLLYALRNDLAILCICALAVLLVVALLGFYVVSVLKAACIPDPQNKKLYVKGFPDRTLDLSNAVMLQTLPMKNGHAIVRTLIFTDAEGNVVAAVPTLFTSNQGVLAEPMAIELAKEMGLSFKANLKPWEYDKEKRKEHDQEVALAEKEASRERFQRFKKKFFKKTKAK